ncbi:Phenylalanine aminomutase (L-beta-phenylalanine forming) [Penicillium soppii]|jgi:hypothetical protein|uniref:Phenylalanine aminomutase (L-beta-phenylalanine forming) n=1 Tax=Penicillium soppii TaxID=69789 RepID=UPI00254725DD|nr:Phenylalanine aminomutase (L-beta-phenylalanine forming) [Penicillium soppii]KAJ5872486.1 Phenylalanine aminomutase (L-beta-phenylalanine forming) [Penicillium soppii]
MSTHLAQIQAFWDSSKRTTTQMDVAMTVGGELDSLETPHVVAVARHLVHTVLGQADVILKRVEDSIAVLD